MNMKKLFSLALLVSAFAAAPVFAMEDAAAGNAAPQPEAPKTEVPAPDAPKGSWCPFAKLAGYPIFSELHGVHNLSAIPGNYYEFVKGLVLNSPVKTFATLLLAKTIYDNVDNIKSALGLSQDEEDADAQVFADAKCGCTDEQAEEEEVVEVCELDKKAAKKANA